MLLEERIIIVFFFTIVVVHSQFLSDYSVIVDKAVMTYQDTRKINFRLVNRVDKSGAAVIDMFYQHKFEVVQGSTSIRIKSHKENDGEYDMEMTKFDVDWCTFRSMNYFGSQTAYKETNLTMCPLKRGYYFQRMLVPNPKDFPPNLPTGKYRLALSFMHQKRQYLKLEIYGKVLKV